MNCPRCGADSTVRETRAGAHLTINRRRECMNGHRFTSVEMHREAACSAKQRLVVFAATVARRAAEWRRDREIARELHRGWQLLAQRYSLTKSAVYLAARRGRAG